MTLLNDKIRTKILDYKITSGQPFEFLLEDGTTLKVTVRLERCLLQVDEDSKPVMNPEGNPIYHFSFSNDLKVIPKDKIVYIPKMTMKDKPPQGLTS